MANKKNEERQFLRAIVLKEKEVRAELQEKTLAKEMLLNNQKRMSAYAIYLFLYIVCMMSILLMPMEIRGILAFTFTGIYIGAYLFEIFNALKLRWDYEDAKEKEKMGKKGSKD